MKLEVVIIPVSDVDPDGNRWLLQEITARLPGARMEVEVIPAMDARFKVPAR